MSTVTGSPHPLSPGEQRLFLCAQAGLLAGAWHFNATVMGERADLVEAVTGIVVEVDGYTYHHTREQFLHDRQRDRQLQLHGWLVLRFTHDEIHSNLLGVVTDIAHAIRQRLDQAKATHDWHTEVEPIGA